MYRGDLIDIINQLHLIDINSITQPRQQQSTHSFQVNMEFLLDSPYSRPKAKLKKIQELKLYKGCAPIIAELT